jgi:hypothetical protein
MIAEFFLLYLVLLCRCHQITVGVVATHSHNAQACHHAPETVGGHTLLPVFKKSLLQPATPVLSGSLLKVPLTSAKVPSLTHPSAFFLLQKALFSSQSFYVKIPPP